MADGVPAAVAVDWGTSSFRAALIDAEGRILAESSGPDGILTARERGFAATLRAHAGAWLDRHGALPILLSGMIGSRNGWVEVPYLTCPAGLADLAEAVAEHREGDLHLRFVPGLITRAADGTPDVMRGEEVQIFGATAGRADAEVVLPGTHSKWASLRAGRIVGFRSFMTGEIFAALSRHTILGQLARGDGHDEAAFAAGVRRGHAEPAFTHAVFAARTLALTGELAPEGVSSYLSGLTIGAEFAGARGSTDPALPHLVVGSGRLTDLYRRAAGLVGLALEPGPEDAAVRGLHAIFRERLS